jgi:hypothetical protein
LRQVIAGPVLRKYSQLSRITPFRPILEGFETIPLHEHLSAHY